MKRKRAKWGDGAKGDDSTEETSFQQLDKLVKCVIVNPLLF